MKGTIRVTNKKIWLAKPHMSKEGFEQQYVQEAFDTNWLAPLGPNVNHFEKEIAEKVQVNHAAALVSGTAAIHLGLKALGVGEGDKVICPSFTFAATANAITYLNAEPIFIDSEELTWNMDPELLEKALEEQDIKAVVVVHLYGVSAQMDKIIEICQKYNVPILEDAAESLGSYYKGKASGTLGDIGIYSFNGNKIITTSGGGMLVSNNKEYVDRVRFWSTQSREQALHYEHKEIGYNYRMSNVVAGIGRGQLKILDRRVAQKKEIFKTYYEGLNDIDSITFMPENDWDKPNYWLSCILLNSEKLQEKIIKVLKEHNIESRPLWKPMHLQPVYQGELSYINGVAENLFKLGLCLPSDTNMDQDDLIKVISIIRKVAA